MADQPQRDPWRIIWQVATSETVLVILLLGIAISLAAASLLPQVPSNGPSAYARWLSHTQARFGEATSTMQALGLFNITRSFGFRTMLALLAGLLLLRLTENVDQLVQGRNFAPPQDNWQELPNVSLTRIRDEFPRISYRVLREPPLLQIDRWPWSAVFPALAHAGSLLLIIGALFAHLWGWQVKDVVLQNGESATFYGATVTLRKGVQVTHSPGIFVSIEERGPGVQVSAIDDDGNTLSLQQAAGSDSSTRLWLALSGDQYFAIPEEQMIIRLAPRRKDPNSPIDVQFYRSPPGRLITEMSTEDDIIQLDVENVSLQLTSAPYARLTITSNPGRWPAILGLLSLIFGLVGKTIWPKRRFWLRQGEDEEIIEGTGMLPSKFKTSDEEKS